MTSWTIHLHYDNTVQLVYNRYPTLMSLAAEFGGLTCLYWMIVSVLAPIGVMFFLHEIAEVIREANRHAYREELHRLTALGISQLKKIRDLSKNNKAYKFIGSDLCDAIDRQTVHGNQTRAGEELYKNTVKYPDEKLHNILDQIILVIQEVQRLCVEHKKANFNNDLEKINTHKGRRTIDKQELNQRKMKGAPRTQSPEKAAKADGGDEADNVASLSHIDIEMGERRSYIRKTNRQVEGNRSFHYRRTAYDVAFAVSITDEILALEPLEDKVQQLKARSRMDTLDILRQLKQRVNFVSLYNLFDQVGQQRHDMLAQQQKIWLHMKNFESEIVLLKSKISRFENIASLLDDSAKC